MNYRDELELGIARAQARVDEMKRRRATGRHMGYDDEIEETETWLADARGSIARTCGRIVVFSRPPRTYPPEHRFEDGSGFPLKQHGFEVVRHGQLVRSVGGRARVFDAYQLLIAGRLAQTGTRHEVMFQAVRLAAMNRHGQIPLYLETSAPRSLRRASLRMAQRKNLEGRRRNRKARKACERLARDLLDSPGLAALLRGGRIQHTGTWPTETP